MEGPWDPKSSAWDPRGPLTPHGAWFPPTLRLRGPKWDHFNPNQPRPKSGQKRPEITEKRCPTAPRRAPMGPSVPVHGPNPRKPHMGYTCLSWLVPFFLTVTGVRWPILSLFGSGLCSMVRNKKSLYRGSPVTVPRHAATAPMGACPGPGPEPFSME